MDQHVKAVGGIVSEQLNGFVTWFFCTSGVFCNVYVSLSWKEKKNLQTLKVLYEGPCTRSVLQTACCTILEGTLNIEVCVKGPL